MPLQPWRHHNLTPTEHPETKKTTVLGMLHLSNTSFAGTKQVAASAMKPAAAVQCCEGA